MDGEKIWFTEWVENNIGVVDTSISLPLDIELESNTVSLGAGQSKDVTYVISPQTSQDLSDVSLILSDTHEFLSVHAESQGSSS